MTPTLKTWLLAGSRKRAQGDRRTVNDDITLLLLSLLDAVLADLCRRARP